MNVRRPLLGVLRLLAVAVGAGLALVLLTLPPLPRDLSDRTPTGRPADPGFPPTISGAYHIHTTRSDGSGTVEEVAAAAARAGLQFIILTDHGDATRPPDPPTYRRGVLVIDGVEISTDDGHYVALGLPAAPYRLAGEARDVAEDVRRLGGFGVAAHPDSPKRDLAWTDWDLPIDGLEWLNADTAWRDESWPSMARLFVRYPFRPAASLMTMLSYPERLMARWDALAATRRVLALAATDAHARLWGRLEVRDVPLPLTLRVPSYERSFRAFALQVQLDRPLTGSGRDDGAQVLEAVRRGRLFSAITALATPPRFDVRALREGLDARMGDEIRAGAPLELVSRVIAPEGTSLRLFENGRLVAEEDAAPELRYRAPGHAAVYRVEVWLPPRRGEAEVPWIVSNPIFVRSPARTRPGPQRPFDSPDDPPSARRQAPSWHADTTWIVEHDPGSSARVTDRSADEAVQFDYTLRPGRRVSQYAAAVTGGLRGVDEWHVLRFRARARRPMRLSVQLRQPGDPGHRWARSVYLDDTTQAISLPLEAFRPVSDAPPRIPLADLHAVLFVVDTVNTHPGTRGTVWLHEVRVE